MCLKFRNSFEFALLLVEQGNFRIMAVLWGGVSRLSVFCIPKNHVSRGGGEALYNQAFDLKCSQYRSHKFIEMKFSAVFLASLIRADPVQHLDFWRECDTFALQIQNDVTKNLGKVPGNLKFTRKYENLKKVMKHYQDFYCDSDFADPTLELVTFREYDEKLNEARNIQNLADMIEEWVESYACFFDKKTKNMFARAVTNLYNTSNKSEFGREEVSFVISEDTMNYFEAAGWCFLQDMWLAELNGPHSDVLIRNVSKNF